MAQPVGYVKDTTPSGLTEHMDNSRPLVNGQPPQFAKMSSPADMKPGVTPFANQHIINSSGSTVSNGPPITRNYTTTGSLSSHSSRNASPTPPVRPIGFSQSMENLSPSTDVNNHSQQENPLSTRPTPYQLPTSRTNPTFEMGSNHHPIMHMHSVPTDLHQGSVDQHQQGQKSHTEPSNPLTPHRLSQHLPQNIPLQSISESNQNHSGNSRISASVDKPPLNSMQHSSLSSSSQPFQVHTHPLTAAQPSFNGPTAAYPSHTNHVNSSLHHPNSLPPVARTSASGILPPDTASQQVHFPNGPSMNPLSNPKTSIQPANQMAQSRGSGPQLSVSSAVPYGGTNLTAGSTATSQQFPGPFSGSSRGTGQPPFSQYSGTGAAPATSVGNPGQIPGPPVSQAVNMPSVRHAVPNSSFQIHQNASGPNMNSSNRTVSPGMPLTGTPGLNQPPNIQQPPFPGMLPTSAPGPNMPSTNRTFSPGFNQPSDTQRPPHPGMPPTNSSRPNMAFNNRTDSPGMPPTNSSGSPGMALTGTPGFNQTPNAQPPHLGVPPTSASDVKPLPVGHVAHTAGTSQPPVSQYPGMPLNSASTPNMMNNNNRTNSPGMPLTGSSGFNQPPNTQQPPLPGVPPTSSSGPTSWTVNPGMLPAGNSGFSQPPNTQQSAHPGMPPTSASGPNNRTVNPGILPTGTPGFIRPPNTQQPPHPGMPPTSVSGVRLPPVGHQVHTTDGSQQVATHYPSMPPSSASGVRPSPVGHQMHTMGRSQQLASQYPGMPPTSASDMKSHLGGNQTNSSAANQQPPTSATGFRPAPVGSQGHTAGASQQGADQYPGMPPTSASGVPSPPGAHTTQPASQYPGMPPTGASGGRPPLGANQQRPTVYPGMPPSNTGQSPASSQQMRYPAMQSSITSPGSGQPPPPSSHPSQFPGVSSQPVTSGMTPTSQYPGMPPMPSPVSSSAGMPPPPPSSNAGSGDLYHSSRRYPQQPGYQMQSQPGVDALSGQMSNMSVTQTGFNKLWGLEYYDLLQTRNILPAEKVEPPKIVLHQEYLDNVNCSPEIFRCTLTKIPESNSLLQKARLPLGILIHPFKDLNHLPVIQCSTIVRCRACRTYINPFVYFVDQKRWKCNLCFRVNELPEEFQYDPVSKTYGCPTRRPEIKSSTMEFIAPSEYMLRPPQPAVYLFLLDVSQMAVESGYLQLVCDILLDEFDKLPGDSRTQIGFITFDSTVHFYNLGEGLSQPQQMVIVDIDDIFLPCPDNLLVNLSESRDLIRDLLTQLPRKFQTSHDPYSVVGPALQVAYKLMSPTGGRVTVFQSCLPTKGPGALTAREDPSQRAGKEAPHLNPAIDFYKRLALDCSGQQIAVDLFVLNSQYCDLATISGISRFSGGCIHHFPLFKASNTLQVENFERVFRRYLKRKIGFEAVMRIRCSRGLAIHTFHGNFFVRSTDLLSLPNVNPDAGFGMQVSIEESLSELQNVCFQAALLYTTSKGERRIRVHTLCLPVATTLPDILHSADQQCIVGLLSKMAVDRSLQTSLSDAREAFINVAIDVLSAYRVVQSSGVASGLLAPHNLRLLPLYILALLKYVAFRSGQSTRLDDRVFAMCQMKTLPLANLIQSIYPDMYPVHCLEEQLVALEDGSSLPQPPRLHLSAEKLDQRGVFLMDTGDHMMLYVGRSVSVEYCTDVFGVPSFSQIPEEMYELPVLETTRSTNLRNFVNYLQSEKPFCATIQVIRDDGHFRSKFIERLIEDRTESAFSYYEFLQHLKTNVK